MSALCIACVFLARPVPAQPAERRPADILITGATIITMDAGRRVLEDSALAIGGDRILEVGSSRDLAARYRARRVIDAANKVVMPGLIDGHGHAGHGLVKSLGTDMPGEWYRACEVIYAEGSTEEFWRADALLTALERLKFGVTCGVTFFGGGDSVMRTDDPRYGDRHMQAVQEVGIREFLAVGPRRPPFPRKYSHWSGDSRRDVMVTFEQQMETSEILAQRWNGRAEGKLHIAVMFPTHHPEAAPLSDADYRDLLRRTGTARQLSRKYGLLFTQDGHSQGTVKFAHQKLGILGPDVLLSHSTELTEEEIRICAETGTRIVHNPSAIASMTGRCPVPELLDAGVTVMLGSDGVAPDRSYDMFRHMFQAMRYHRFYYRDPGVLPPGKVLEMVTIDAARALGMEKELGSLEPGKKADAIIVDMFKPHLYPLHMPAYRVAYFANGNDVDTVIVNGEILMEGRKVLTVNEAEVLNLAQQEAEAALRRTNLHRLLAIPDGFWRTSRSPSP
ncbi:MAG: amidohydrolase family protein [Acidobacteria bacterium]|nr:amidohydrolase family protein [Acidobacteriota bacterium]